MPIGKDITMVYVLKIFSIFDVLAFDEKGRPDLSKAPKRAYYENYFIEDLK